MNNQEYILENETDKIQRDFEIKKRSFNLVFKFYDLLL